MTYKHSLADVIACSVWQPDSPPKDLVPPTRPYSYDEDACEASTKFGRLDGNGRGAKPKAPSESEFGQRLLAVLRRYDVPVSTCDLAIVLRAQQTQVNAKLRALEGEGLVERVVRPGYVVHWKMRPTSKVKIVIAEAA